MDVLKKHITSFSFVDIEEFCKQGYREGIQLDYKKDIPKDSFSKHFASFSNTRGGAIIIGVEEDRTTGLPIAWNGIKMRQGLIEKIHQDANHVEQNPAYDVHVTNDIKGMVFVLIRVYEGDMTPYYVQNDANIWVRTGNISKPIDIASPEATELLFGKREKAELARKNNLDKAGLLYNAGLKRAELERKGKIAMEKEEFQRQHHVELQQGKPLPPFTSNIYQQILGSETTGTCTITLQPYYPRKALATPKDLMGKVNDIKVSTRDYGSFPHLYLRPIPEGLFDFRWGERDGTTECEQLYASGLVYQSEDIMRVDEEGSKLVWISTIVSSLFTVLKAASKFYTLYGYQGGVAGHIRLQNMEGVLFKKIVPRGWHDPFNMLSDIKSSLLPEYTWELKLDTSTLSDDAVFKEFFFEKIREIYWSLGYADVSDELLEAFYQQL